VKDDDEDAINVAGAREFSKFPQHERGGKGPVNVASVVEGAAVAAAHDVTVAKGHGEVSEGSDQANGTSNKAVDTVTEPGIVDLAVAAEILESPPEEEKGREGKETEAGPERPALVLGEGKVASVPGAGRAAAARPVLLVLVFSGVGGLVGRGAISSVTSVTGISRVVSKSAVGVLSIVNFVAAFVAAVAGPGQAGTSLAVHARGLSGAGGHADLGVVGVASRFVGFSVILLRLGFVAGVRGRLSVVLSLAGSAKGEHAEEEGKLHGEWVRYWF